LNDYLSKNSSLCTIYYTKLYLAGQLRILQKRAPNTHDIHSELCLPVASVETLPGHPDTFIPLPPKMQPHTCGSYYVLGYHLEVLSRRLMLSHYCQTADRLSPVTSRPFPKNSVLLVQVYNIAMHGYGISLHS
jgi:hypothetical protein